jgi:hypothetical protein
LKNACKMSSWHADEKPFVRSARQTLPPVR